MHIGDQNIQDVLTADNMNETLILLVSNTLTALGAWFVGKRKQQVDTDNQVLRNLELAIGLYKTLIDDLKNEISELNFKIQQLEKKVDELHTENKKLKSKI